MLAKESLAVIIETKTVYENIYLFCVYTLTGSWLKSSSKTGDFSGFGFLCETFF